MFVKKPSLSLQSKSENQIEVLVRIRPFFDNHDEEYQLYDQQNPKIINCSGKKYLFDRVFYGPNNDDQLFQNVGVKLVKNTLDGYNSCLFAYGQTGTGKTYTMTGTQSSDGIIQKSLKLLWNLVEKDYLYENFQIRLSYLEIYNETIRDLLSEKDTLLILRESSKKGFYVEGLSEKIINDEKDFQFLIDKGKNNRITKSTLLNEESSRSHSVLTIEVQMKIKTQNGQWIIRSSQLNFVDLAGSEKQKQTDTKGERLKEASSINKSLTALSTVFAKLAQSKAKTTLHIPFRDSVLTKLMKNSLGGNSKTTIIGCISGKKEFMGETISTLLFLERAKRLKNQAVVNEEVEGSSEALKSTINELNHKISALEQLNRQLQSSLEESKKNCSRYEQQIQALKQKIDLFEAPFPYSAFDLENKPNESALCFDAETDLQKSQILFSVIPEEEENSGGEINYDENDQRTIFKVQKRHQCKSQKIGMQSQMCENQNRQKIYQEKLKQLNHYIHQNHRLQQENKKYFAMLLQVQKNIDLNSISAIQTLLTEAYKQKIVQLETELHYENKKYTQMKKYFEKTDGRRFSVSSNSRQTQFHILLEKKSQQFQEQQKRLVEKLAELNRLKEQQEILMKQRELGLMAEKERYYNELLAKTTQNQEMVEINSFLEHQILDISIQLQKCKEQATKLSEQVGCYKFQYQKQRNEILTQGQLVQQLRNVYAMQRQKQMQLENSLAHHQNNLNNIQKLVECKNLEIENIKKEMFESTYESLQLKQMVQNYKRQQEQKNRHISESDIRILMCGEALTISQIREIYQNQENSILSLKQQLFELNGHLQNSKQLFQRQILEKNTTMIELRSKIQTLNIANQQSADYFRSQIEAKERSSQANLRDLRQAKNQNEYYKQQFQAMRNESQTALDSIRQLQNYLCQNNVEQMKQTIIRLKEENELMSQSMNELKELAEKKREKINMGLKDQFYMLKEQITQLEAKQHEFLEKMKATQKYIQVVTNLLDHERSKVQELVRKGQTMELNQQNLEKEYRNHLKSCNDRQQNLFASIEQLQKQKCRKDGDLKNMQMKYATIEKEKYKTEMNLSFLKQAFAKNEKKHQEEKRQLEKRIDQYEGYVKPIRSRQ